MGGANNFFEISANGSPATPFFLSGGAQTISTLMQCSIDLGYDGWMHDFGEYVARSSRFADGRMGLEMHNAFPLLLCEGRVRFLRSAARA